MVVAVIERAPMAKATDTAERAQLDEMVAEIRRLVCNRNPAHVIRLLRSVNNALDQVEAEAEPEPEPLVAHARR